jgi:helix-turn-helix protein
MIYEGKQLWGYNKKLDKLISANEIKGQDIWIAAFWFISKNKYIVVPYSDISNPQEASTKWEGEFKSPDTYVETHLVNNKPVSTDTYIRVK